MTRKLQISPFVVFTHFCKPWNEKVWPKIHHNNNKRYSHTYYLILWYSYNFFYYGTGFTGNVGQAMADTWKMGHQDTRYMQVVQLWLGQFFPLKAVLLILVLHQAL